MVDERIRKLAEILIYHSLSIKKNDLFLINGGYLSLPLIKEVYRIALQIGANPYVKIGVEDLSELFFKYASEEQLTYVSPIIKYELEKVDVRLSILSPENTRYMTKIDPEKQAVRSRSQQELHERFLERSSKGELRWCITQFPTNAAAQDASMSLMEYEEFLFKAAHVDEKDPLEFWRKLKEKQKHLIEILETKNSIHIIAEDTDLKLSISNRKWINCYGKENFPDGEIFTGPIENSAEGYIKYSFPTVYGGRLVDGIQLWFEKGKVIKSKATLGEKFLETMLNMDEGAKRIGEFAFGTNYGIKHYTKNTLFDEKIGGTIHLALGSGYPETGSINKSSLHWDMMCDLRKYGEIYTDDELIYKNGEFLI